MSMGSINGVVQRCSNIASIRPTSYTVANPGDQSMEISTSSVSDKIKSWLRSGVTGPERETAETVASRTTSTLPHRRYRNDQQALYSRSEGRQIVPGSKDKFIRVWDALIGGALSSQRSHRVGFIGPLLYSSRPSLDQTASRIEFQSLLENYNKSH